MAGSLDDPEVKRRTVRALVRLSPFLFAGSYLLAAAQGAQGRHALLIAGVAAGMSLGAAACIHLFGSRSSVILSVVAVLLAILARCA